MCVTLQIPGPIRPHAIIILPNKAGTEVLVCYEDEGVYIDTYGRITKDTVLQWGEMPTSVGNVGAHTFYANAIYTHKGLFLYTVRLCAGTTNNNPIAMISQALLNITVDFSSSTH